MMRVGLGRLGTWTYRRATANIWAAQESQLLCRWSSSVGSEEVSEAAIVSEAVEAREVPRLPMPDLKNTCNEYVKQISVLVDKDDAERVSQLAMSFCDGEGRDLHEELERLDKENSGGSWLSGFWESMYLNDRNPLPINTNPFFILENIVHESDRHPQLSSSARLIRSTAKFHHRMRTGQMPQEMQGDLPLCSRQLPRLLASARVPGSVRDTYESYPDSNHVVVCLNGFFFAFQVLDSDGNLISQVDCEKVIQKCIKMAMDENVMMEGSVPNNFTALDRSTWAELRSEITASSPLNEGILTTIDRAIAVFHVVVEDVQGGAMEDELSEEQKLDLLGQHALTPDNGWFDKLQFFVHQDGRYGVNMEHTAVDGHSLLSFLKYMIDDVKVGVPTEAGVMERPKPVGLYFQLDEKFQEIFKRAAETITESRHSVRMSVLDYSLVGKKWLKSKKLSPDAFAQLGFHLAYFDIHGHVPVTYESVMMKHFKYGRTETGRPMTEEASQFVELMSDPLASVEDKAAAIRAAADAHVAQIKNCQAGRGFDRHLFALKNLAKLRMERLDEYKIPEIFTHQSYAVCSSFLLSTSNCGMDGVSSFGFGPVCEGGYGVGYMIADDRIMANISSWSVVGPMQSELFKRKLAKAYTDMYRILEAPSSTGKTP